MSGCIREIRRGRICFCISEGCCIDVTVLPSPSSSFSFTVSRFYSPQECSSFILASVYIPHQACVRETLQRLANQITSMEQQHPDARLIILGDFNRANTSHEQHKYRQYIGRPAGRRNTLSQGIKGCSLQLFKPSDHLSPSNLKMKTRNPKSVWWTFWEDGPVIWLSSLILWHSEVSAQMENMSSHSKYITTKTDDPLIRIDI